MEASSVRFSRNYVPSFALMNEKRERSGLMTYTYLNNAKHWRDRAEETRAKADLCWQEEAKQRMLRIAFESTGLQITPQNAPAPINS